MKQRITGDFRVTFFGIPLIFVSKSVLTPRYNILMPRYDDDKSIDQTGNSRRKANIYSLHITPWLAIGFVVIKKAHL